MVSIVWLIVGCLASMGAGMMLMEMCVASGNADDHAPCRERIHRLELLLRAQGDGLDRWHTDVFAAPPDEDNGEELTQEEFDALPEFDGH